MKRVIGSFDMAWAAGLFEGEGSVVLRHRKPVLQLRNCDHEVIERFADVVMLGRVYGPYDQRRGDGYVGQPFFHWTAPPDESQVVLESLWPWLGTRRRRRALEIGFRLPLSREEVA